MQNDKGRLPFDQKFRNFRNGHKWYENFRGKVPENPEIVEFPKSKPFNPLFNDVFAADVVCARSLLLLCIKSHDVDLSVFCLLLYLWIKPRSHWKILREQLSSSTLEKDCTFCPRKFPEIRPGIFGRMVSAQSFFMIFSPQLPQRRSLDSWAPVLEVRNLLLILDMCQPRQSSNRPFPSSLVALFQSESKCETILTKMTLICMKIKLHAELIFRWKVSHLDSFWNRVTREFGNGLLAGNLDAKLNWEGMGMHDKEDVLNFSWTILSKGERCSEVDPMWSTIHVTKPDRNTGNFVPYSLQQVCGFSNVPC